ncbi:V-type ATP synthase subunit E [Clostridium cellulovorans]|uniref:V-type proton ATPase subunit E n=1 Tax=Clostridium cellulovorans (strain ATCC 35296 / DSM 3052 / OCM 3 / 743B) TaxID=573061 RepID=D9SX40_CLOC7|nr:V-type ATP synthase subunit E family protein [Clostridium cellulovorans]ADL51401.1 H+transporting two-sector ATPase E subunit [Clostridium cellulovorans 743B]
MSNIKNITEKILKDSEHQAIAIIKASEVEAEKIITKKISEAKSIAENILAKAEVEGKSKRDRIISNNQLKIRNEKLAAKQQVIEEIYKDALEELQKLNGDDYRKFIIDKVLSMELEGDEKLILSHKDTVDEDNIIADINSRFKAKGKKHNISLGERRNNFTGGFIIEKDGIEINNTFEALINLMKEELEFEVAKVLFS